MIHPLLYMLVIVSPLLVGIIVSLHVADFFWVSIIISFGWIYLSRYIGEILGGKYRKLTFKTRLIIMIFVWVVLIVLGLFMLYAAQDIIVTWLKFYISAMLICFIIVAYAAFPRRIKKPLTQPVAQPRKNIAEWIEIKSSAQYVGDLNLKKLNCDNCGAPLDEDSISIKARAVQVSCPYCGTSYLSQRA